MDARRDGSVEVAEVVDLVPPGEASHATAGRR